MSRFNERDKIISSFVDRGSKEHKYLTNGKVYEVLMVMKGEVLILNDKYMYEYYSDELFLTKGEYRDRTINDILD